MAEYSTEIIRDRVARFKARPDLVILDLSETGAVNADVQLMMQDADLRGLVGLDLSGTAVDSNALGYLVGLRWLRKLRLDYTKVDDEGLKDLANLPELVELSLGTTEVCGEGLKYLGGHGAPLRVLKLDGARRVTDEGLRHLGSLRLLRELELSITVVGDGMLEHVAGLSNLTQLFLNATRVTDRGLKHLQDLSMMALGLNETEVGDEGMGYLSRVDSLRRLGLFQTRITDDGLQAVGGLNALRALRLAYTRKVGDRGMEHLARLQSLTFLDLCETGVGDAGLRRLSELPSLRELNVAGTGVTDAGLADFTAGSGASGVLVKLLLSGTEVGDKGMIALSAMKQLQHLEIEDCHYVTDISPLRALTPANGGSLRRLSVFGCRAIAKGAWTLDEPAHVMDAAEGRSAGASAGIEGLKAEEKKFLLDMLEAIHHRLEKPVTSQSLIGYLKRTVRPKFKGLEAYYQRIRFLKEELGLVSRSKTVLSLTSQGMATLRQYRPQLFEGDD